IGNAAPALKVFADIGVRLETLHLVEWRKPGIAVIQADHEAERDQILAEMVKERSAVNIGAQRPTQSMLNQPWLVVRGGDFPQFLDTDRIGLRIAALAQVEALHQLLGQRPSAAFSEQRIFRAQFN